MLLGTGKLRAYWEDKIYVVTTKDTKLPLFTIKPEEGGQERKVHRNNITNCNFLYSKFEQGLCTDGKKQNRKSDKISLFKSNLQSPLKTDSDSENETMIITNIMGPV